MLLVVVSSEGHNAQSSRDASFLGRKEVYRKVIERGVPIGMFA